MLSAVAAALLAVVSAGVVGVISDAGFAASRTEGSELLVSFKHPGAIGQDCRVLSEEELAARPVHMRREKECERRRASVRLLVEVDDGGELGQVPGSRPYEEVVAGLSGNLCRCGTYPRVFRAVLDTAEGR